MKPFFFSISFFLCFSALAQQGISTPTSFVDTARMRYTWEGEVKDKMRQGVWTGTGPFRDEITCVYVDGKLNGKWLGRFSNGDKMEDGMYVNNLRSGRWVSFNAMGDTILICHYKNGILEGEYKTFANKLPTRYGVFVNGKKEGQWVETAYSNKKLHAKVTYTYKNDTLNGPTVVHLYSGVKTTTYDMGKVVSRDSTMTIDTAYVNRPWPVEDVLMFAEEMPQFPGGQAGMHKFLQDNIQYPETALKKKKQGTVYIKFTIEKDGAVSEVGVAKGIENAPELDAEAVRVFEGMPNWEPGLMNGKPVRVSMTMPVKFVLD